MKLDDAKLECGGVFVQMASKLARSRSLWSIRFFTFFFFYYLIQHKHKHMIWQIEADYVFILMDLQKDYNYAVA